MKLFAILKAIEAIFQIFNKVEDIKDRKARRKALSKRDKEILGGKVEKIINEIPEPPPVTDEIERIRDIIWTHRYITKEKFKPVENFLNMVESAPINIRVASFDKNFLVNAPRQRGSFHAYAIRKGKDIGQEHAGHETNQKFSKMFWGKCDEILVVQAKGNKIIGRSKLTEV